MGIKVLMVGVLALGCGAAQAQDCHLKQYADISFTRTPEGLTLPVKIGDAQKDLAFSLGSASNTLRADTVDELKLHETTISANSHVHREEGEVHYVAHAPRIAIDGNPFKEVQFLILPAKPGGNTGEIGTQIFENADIELDMAAGKLNLFAPDHCPGKAVYWTNTGFAKLPLEIDDHDYIRVQMQLDGKPVMLALNTEGRSVIGMNAMRKIFGVDATSPGMTQAFTNARGEKYYQYTFQKLETEGLAINHPAILVRDEPEAQGCIAGTHIFSNGGPVTGAIQTNILRDTHCHGQADGTLGLSVLSKLHVYVSKKEKLLYLTGAGAH